MLESFRKGSKTWLGRVILIVAGLSLSLFAFEALFRGGAGSIAATVGDESITTAQFAREYEQTVRRMERRGIERNRTAAMGAPGFVLRQLARQSALRQEAARMGVSVSDAQVDAAIRANPAFQNALGEFDPASFQIRFRGAGVSEADYYEGERTRLATDLLIDSLAAEVAAPRAMAETIWRRRNETRDIRFIQLDAEAAAPTEAPSDDELRAFYEAEAVRFTEPERRRIVFLRLRDVDLAASIEISDDEARALYDARSDQYAQPERRNLSQIVFSDEAEAQEAAARIADGDQFARIATERGLSDADVSLGYRTADDDELAPAVLEAAFGLQIEGVVGPVQTPFGWTLIEIRGVAPAQVTSFDEARAELAAELALEAARALLPEKFDAIEDLRAEGASLEAVGEIESVLVREVEIDIDGLDADGAPAPDLPNDPAFLETAFEMSVGDVMNMTAAADGGYYAISVREVREAAPKAFEEVRDDVAAAWIARQTAARLAERADEALERLNGGETLETLAAEFGAEVETVVDISQDLDPDADQNSAAAALSPEVVAAVFTVSLNDPFDAVADGDDGPTRVIGRVTRAEAPNTAEAGAEIDELAIQLGRTMGGDVVELYATETLREIGFEPDAPTIDYVVRSITDPESIHGGM